MTDEGTVVETADWRGASWKTKLREARYESGVLFVYFPSHDPERFEAIVQSWGIYSQVIELIQGALWRGCKIVLIHELSAQTITLLPDLIRYVDDHLRGIQGIRFTTPSAPHIELSADELRPWLRSAMNVCVSREVQFEVAPDLANMERHPNQGIKERAQELPCEAYVERIMSCDWGDNLDGQMAEAERIVSAKWSGDDSEQLVRSLFERMGSIDRFIGDQVGFYHGESYPDRFQSASLGLSEEEFRELGQRDPRGASMFSRSLPAHTELTEKGGINPNNATVLFSLGYCDLSEESPKGPIRAALLEQIFRLTRDGFHRIPPPPPEQKVQRLGIFRRILRFLRRLKRDKELGQDNEQNKRSKVEPVRDVHLSLSYPSSVSSGGEKLLEDLRALCATHQVIFHEIAQKARSSSVPTEAQEADEPVPTEHFKPDFVVNLAAVYSDTFSGAVEAGLPMLPPSELGALRREVMETWFTGTHPKQLLPLSVSLERLVQDAWERLQLKDRYALSEDDVWIDLLEPSRANLWILDVLPSSYVLAAMDPVGLDRCALDSMGQRTSSQPGFHSLVQAKVPYARHEGIQLYGDLDTVLDSHAAKSPLTRLDDLRPLFKLLGGLDRFIGDGVGDVFDENEYGERLRRGQLSLSDEELTNLRHREPRTASLFERSLAAHLNRNEGDSPDTTKSPYLINLGWWDLSQEEPRRPVRANLLDRLLELSRSGFHQLTPELRGLPEAGHVTIAHPGDASAAGAQMLEEISSTCARYHIAFHEIITSEDNLADAPHDGEEEVPFTFVVNLCTAHKAPFRGALESSLPLVGPERAIPVRDHILTSWISGDHPLRLRSLSLSLAGLTVQAWNATEPTPRLSRTTAGTWVDVLAPSRADLWLIDVVEKNFILSALDPIPLDRLSMDGMDLPHSDYAPIATLVEHKIPFARHEGVQLYGDVDMARLEPSERLAPPRLRVPGKKLIILGVASTTLQNHGAVLLMDGEIVAAVQEERIRRQKQQGWHPPGKDRDTVVSNPRIPLERSYPTRSIQTVLDMAGITMDDVDYVAHNGVPQQFFHTYDLLDPNNPPHTVLDGRNIFIPHHLAHAASTYRVSGMEDAFVFTVDGSGERETAAFFEARDGRLHRIFDVLCVEDSLIGGVYEFFTTILGFGHHGQGSTMGLACMGKNSIDLSAYLSAKDRSDYSIHDRNIMEDFGHLARDRNGPMEQEHKDLAASLQKALEDTIIRFIEDGLDGRPCPKLALAGGVALNCRMNQVLRQRFGVEEIFVQPAAHDAGTALGAALEAHFELTGEATPHTMNHAYFGPSFTNDHVEAALQEFGLPYHRSEDVSTEAAELILRQKVLCWFQGGMEFGPRALGARSIIADPRSMIVKDRINVMKGRQWWRPLGPSILSGHEADWFEHPMHSPFMLFTLPVLKEKQPEIPAVLHFDGTTRPQSVTQEANPRYHAMIDHFFKKTGVPMVINTSFNTAFEPIVQTPQDAIASFLQLGADALVIEDFIVHRNGSAVPQATAPGASS